MAARPVASSAGSPAVYTTYVRPDAVHTSYYSGLMWLDTKLLKARVRRRVAASPAAGRTRGARRSPTAERTTLIAAFNSGFKMDSANGGVYLDGEEMRAARRRARRRS